jgi:hypothetical protein
MASERHSDHLCLPVQSLRDPTNPSTWLPLRQELQLKPEKHKASITGLNSDIEIVETPLVADTKENALAVRGRFLPQKI